MNPDTIGYVWTGEYDLNTLRVDGEIFESGKKTADSKISGYVGTGPKLDSYRKLTLSRKVSTNHRFKKPQAVREILTSIL